MLQRRRKLIFTTHALKRMSRRGITKQDVEAAVDNHHTAYPGTHPKHNTLVLVGAAPNQRPLSVVVEKRRPRVVVTAYWRDEP